MTDALRTGADRLAKDVVIRMMGGTPVDSRRIPIATLFAADPGVKALVEFVQAIADAGFNVPAQHALKLWERGNE